jgi:hypothetical protein
VEQWSTTPEHIQLTRFLSTAYKKLKPYGFYIHGGIDGGSNFVVYARVATCKNAAALYKGYRQAVQAYGRPLRLRADMAFEAAVGIGADMNDHRGDRAYLVGPSTANQVRFTILSV